MLIDALWNIVYSYLKPDESLMVQRKDSSVIAFSKRKYWQTNDPGWILFDIMHYDISLIEPLYKQALISKEDYFSYLCNENLEERILAFLHSNESYVCGVPYALFEYGSVTLLAQIIQQFEWMQDRIPIFAPHYNRMDVLKCIQTYNQYYSRHRCELSPKTNTDVLNMLYDWHWDKLVFLKQVMEENGNLIWALTKHNDIDSLQVDFTNLCKKNLLYTDLECFKWFYTTGRFRLYGSMKRLSKPCLEYCIKMDSYLYTTDYTSELHAGFKIRDMEIIEYAIPYANYTTDDIEEASCRHDDWEFFVTIRCRYPDLIVDPLWSASCKHGYRIMYNLMQEQQIDIFQLKYMYTLQPEDIVEYHILDPIYLPHCTDRDKMKQLVRYIAQYVHYWRLNDYWLHRFYQKHFFMTMTCAWSLKDSFRTNTLYDAIYKQYPFDIEHWDIVLDYLDEPFQSYVISGNPNFFLPIK